MTVTCFSNLNELNPSFEVINYLLITLSVPPLDREIVFTSGSHNPKWRIFSGNLVHLRQARPLVFRKVYITPVTRRLDLEIQNVVEVITKPPNEVIWGRVALMNKRIVAVYDGYRWVSLFH